MPTVLYSGNKRHGKTQMAVIEAVDLSNRYKVPLYANTPLNSSKCPRFIYWEDPKELLKVKKNSIVLFDELPTSLDSRNWKSRDQVLFTHWFAQTEKMGIHFIYTAQRLHTIEKRIRDQTDEIYEVFKIAGNPYIFYVHMDSSRDWPGVVLERAQLYQPPFYDLYDTYATVKSFMTL